MRKLALAAVLGLLSGVPARASIYDDFTNHAASQFLEPFARDVGGLIGATDFHSARLPALAGFDVSVLGTTQFKPDSSNGILNQAGLKFFGLPYVRAEAGLPFGVSAFLRGIPYQSANLIGGGLRYQVYKSGLLLAIPDVAVTVGYDKLTQDAVHMSHIGGSVQASFNIPVIHPFIGVGYDSTKLTVEQAVNGVPVGADATGKGVRTTIGASATLIPFTEVFGSYSNLHGNSAAEFGIGVKFGGL